MNKSITFNESNAAYAISDLDIIENPDLASSAEMVTNKTHQLICQIKHTYQYPFCEINFNFETLNEEYADLSGYETIDLTLSYSAPIENNNRFLRIQVRGFSPKYSVLEDVNTYKLNEAKLLVAQHNNLQTYRLHFSEFFVPQWWLDEMKLGVEHSQPEFSRAINIKVMTPDTVLDGEHIINVESIKLYGKWLSFKHLQKGLIILWISLVVAGLIQLLRHFNLRRIQLVAAQLELQEINKALEIETKELQGLVRRDSLTGVRNRHGIRDLMVKLLAKTSDKDFHLSVMYIDLDHFKNINDTFGHEVGDQVLIRFASLISKNIRDNDVFARWGGEEFILISPEYNFSKAQLLAEKLRILVERECWPAQINLTCSIGVTEYKPGEDFSELLKRADQALYRSKSEGRNRSTIAY